jgi:hypothetical protein
MGRAFPGKKLAASLSLFESESKGVNCAGAVVRDRNDPDQHKVKYTVMMGADYRAVIIFKVMTAKGECHEKQ